MLQNLTSLCELTIASMGNPRTSTSARSPPELHPMTKTQAVITFYWIKLIKNNWYENYSEKLRDHEFLVELTNWLLRGMMQRWVNLELPLSLDNSASQFRQEKILNPVIGVDRWRLWLYPYFRLPASPYYYPYTRAAENIWSTNHKNKSWSIRFSAYLLFG